MKEPEYAVTISDKWHRLLSLLVLLSILAIAFTSEGSTRFRLLYAPFVATVAIWFTDSIASHLSWRNAPRDIRFLAWAGLIVCAIISFISLAMRADS